MPNKQDITLDFPGSVTPTQDTVSGGGAPAPSDRNPGLLHPTPGLEWVASSVYMGLGGAGGARSSWWVGGLLHSNRFLVVARSRDGA